ncbi:MAG: hypothetical protein DRP78_01540 [Candidatus Omnitrophota bacterium]|nr:MAG: hypothetical protein DRP78_01540 [Candidatus Omnitrophota bacterium]
MFFFLVVLIFSAVFVQRKYCFVDFNNPQNSITQRANYWKSSFKLIKEKPFRGIGQGNFGIVYPSVKSADANETNYPHNIYLQIGVESGIFALIAFIIFVVYLFKEALVYRNPFVAAGFICAISAFLVQNLFDYSFFVPQTAITWWVLAGAVIGYNSSISDKNKRENGYIYKLIVCFFGVFLLYNLFSQYNYEQNIQKSYCLSKNAKYAQAIEAVKRAVKIFHDNDFSYYFLANLYKNKHKPNFSDLAVKNYQQAIFFSPQYAFYYYDLSKYFLTYGKKQQSEFYLHKAIDCYPGISKQKTGGTVQEKTAL